MEQFTNDLLTLFNAAKAEILGSNAPENQKGIYSFCKFPSIAGYPYKLLLCEDSDHNLICHFWEWDTAYDMERWKLGIYNCDRIRFVHQQRILENYEKESVLEIIKNLNPADFPEKLNDEKALILDGSEFRLNIYCFNQEFSYIWKAALSEISIFVPIIDFLLAFHPKKA